MLFTGNSSYVFSLIIEIIVSFIYHLLDNLLRCHGEIDNAHRKKLTQHTCHSENMSPFAIFFLKCQPEEIFFHITSILHLFKYIFFIIEYIAG